MVLRRIILGLLCVLLPVVAQAAITTDNESFDRCFSCSPLTISHTVGVGMDGALYIGVHLFAGGSIASVTVDGNAATFVDSSTLAVCSSGLSCHAELWRSLNPSAGTRSIVITPGASTSMAAGGLSLFGVHQTTPEGTLQKTTGTSATPSVTVTSASDERVVGVISLNHGGGSALSASGGGTLAYSNFDSQGFIKVAMSHMPGAASANLAVSNPTAEPFAMLAVPVKPATGSAPATYETIVVSQTGTSQTGTGTSVAKAYGSNNAAGSLLYAIVHASHTATGVTDLLNPAWSFGCKLSSGASNFLELWYLKNSLAGANTVTAAFGASTSYNSISIYEATGVDRTSPLETCITNNQTSVAPGTDAVTSTPVVSTINNSLVVGAGETSGATITAGTGYTSREQPFAPNTRHEDKIFAIAGSTEALFTTSGSTGNTKAIGAIFKPRLLTAPIAGLTELLQWTDNANNETQFRLQWKHTAQPTYADLAILGVNTQSYLVNYTTETMRCYQVRAEGEGGISSYSNELCSFTTAAGPIQAPLTAPNLGGGLADE